MEQPLIISGRALERHEANQLSSSWVPDEGAAETSRQPGRLLSDVYNVERIDSSPVDLTPAESQQQWLRGQKAALP
jgi:hypothetical protein